MKNHITILLAALLTVGCAGTARFDGGRSSTYAQGQGSRINGPSISLLGGQLRLLSFEKETGLSSSIDEPTMAAGSSIASKSSAESLAAESQRNGTNGLKVVRYGAANVKTDAQKLAEILTELERIKNGLPGTSR